MELHETFGSLHVMQLQNRLSELIVSAEIDVVDLIRFALFQLSFNLNAIRMYVYFS